MWVDSVGFRPVMVAITAFAASSTQQGIASLMNGCYTIADCSVAFPRASLGMGHPYLRAIMVEVARI